MRFLLLAALCLTFTLPAVAAPSSASSSSGAKAFGFTDSSNLLNGQSASALFGGTTDWIHVMLAINKTLGAFEFGVGGIYKFTVLGDRRTGFHMGPGVSVGTVAVGGKSKFGFSISGLAGAHWTIFDRMIVSVDGGPAVAVVDGDANFSFRPIGDLLGLSLHYLF